MKLNKELLITLLEEIIFMALDLAAMSALD